MWIFHDAWCRTNLTIYSQLSNGLHFRAIRKDAEMPSDVKAFLDKYLQVKTMFGTECYLWLNDDYKDPINNIAEALQASVYAYLDAATKADVFEYYWT